MLLVRRGGDRGERGHGAAPLHHEGVALVAAAAVPAGRVRAGGGGGTAGQPSRGGRGEFFCKRWKERFGYKMAKGQKSNGETATRRRDMMQVAKSIRITGSGSGRRTTLIFNQPSLDFNLQ